MRPVTDGDSLLLDPYRTPLLLSFLIAVTLLMSLEKKGTATSKTAGI
jgi:hypothetical protein